MWKVDCVLFVTNLCSGVFVAFVFSAFLWEKGGQSQLVFELGGKERLASDFNSNSEFILVPSKITNKNAY